MECVLNWYLPEGCLAELKARALEHDRREFQRNLDEFVDATLNEKGARIIASLRPRSGLHPSLGLLGSASLLTMTRDSIAHPWLRAASAACHGAWWAASRMLTNLLRP
jgi:hypothetical protein